MHFKPGVYIVNISNGAENFRQKLIIEKIKEEKL
jgi:hypothetical protein